jgi:hypothetical protein
MILRLGGRFVSSHSDIEDDNDDDEKKSLMKPSEGVVADWTSSWAAEAQREVIAVVVAVAVVVSEVLVVRIMREEE